MRTLPFAPGNVPTAGKPKRRPRVAVTGGGCTPEKRDTSRFEIGTDAPLRRAFSWSARLVSKAWYN